MLGIATLWDLLLHLHTDMMLRYQIFSWLWPGGGVGWESTFRSYKRDIAQLKMVTINAWMAIPWSARKWTCVKHPEIKINKRWVWHPEKDMNKFNFSILLGSPMPYVYKSSESVGGPQPLSVATRGTAVSGLILFDRRKWIQYVWLKLWRSYWTYSFLATPKKIEHLETWRYVNSIYHLLETLVYLFGDCATSNNDCIMIVNH